MVFATPTISWERRHCPIHGPQALAKTVPLSSSSEAICPCPLDGGADLLRAWGHHKGQQQPFRPWRAPAQPRPRRRLISSLEELVQLPMSRRRDVINEVLLWSCTSGRQLRDGRSTVWRVWSNDVGSSLDRSISTIRSK